MGVSNYYQELRNKVGNDLILMPSVAGIIRNEAGNVLFQNKGNGEKSDHDKTEYQWDDGWMKSQ